MSGQRNLRPEEAIIPHLESAITYYEGKYRKRFPKNVLFLGNDSFSIFHVNHSRNNERSIIGDTEGRSIEFKINCKSEGANPKEIPLDYVLKKHSEFFPNKEIGLIPLDLGMVQKVRSLGTINEENDDYTLIQFGDKAIRLIKEIETTKKEFFKKTYPLLCKENRIKIPEMPKRHFNQDVIDRFTLISNPIEYVKEKKENEIGALVYLKQNLPVGLEDILPQTCGLAVAYIRINDISPDDKNAIIEGYNARLSSWKHVHSEKRWNEHVLSLGYEFIEMLVTKKGLRLTKKPIEEDNYNKEIKINLEKGVTLNEIVIKLKKKYALFNSDTVYYNPFLKENDEGKIGAYILVKQNLPEELKKIPGVKDKCRVLLCGLEPSISTDEMKKIREDYESELEKKEINGILNRNKDSIYDSWRDYMSILKFKSINIGATQYGADLFSDNFIKELEELGKGPKFYGHM